MDILYLCEKIKLQPEIKKQVEVFIKDFDFKKIDEIQQAYFVREKMQSAFSQVQEVLGNDENGIKTLACMLQASVNAYKTYKQKGIDEEIFFDTMKVYTRFIDETYLQKGTLSFDRGWWTIRQAGCHLFRLGELEYETVFDENQLSVYMHIPSDARILPQSVDASLEQARSFIKKQYPKAEKWDFYCHSWLLDSQLKEFLNEKSNIVSFQNRFEVIDDSMVDSNINKWLFNTASTDYNTFCENTSLQKNVKRHLLAGGVIKCVKGKLKNRLD